MRTIFHIGLHKTGTTSLQRFLQVNQTVLAQNGILYPPTTPRGLARMLATSTGHLAPTAPHDPKDTWGHNALAYRLICEADPQRAFPPHLGPMPSGAMAFEIINQIAQQTQAHSLIFSSENFARLAIEAPTAVTRLKDHFGRSQTQLLCTIRRPDQAIEAWQTQSLSFPEPLPRLTDRGIADYLGSVHIAYPDILALWQTTFPGIDLHVTPYSETLASGGAVQHFATSANLTLPQGLHTSTNHNISLHPALFEIARLGKERLDNREAYFLRIWLAKIQHDLALPDKSQIEFLGPKNRADLARAFAPVHQRLSQITGRAAFFADIEDIAKSKPIPATKAAAAHLPSLKSHAAPSLPPSPHKTFLLGLSDSDFR